MSNTRSKVVGGYLVCLTGFFALCGCGTDTDSVSVEAEQGPVTPQRQEGSGKQEQVLVLKAVNEQGAETPAAGQFDEVEQLSEVYGGLCVQLGGNVELTVRLASDEGFEALQEERFLVHRLDNDSERVDGDRQFLESKGLYGPVSLEHWTSKKLPYADNLVNCVVAEDLMEIPQKEIMRVLCPNGIAYLKRDDTYERLVKPRPAEMDEWTHQWHGPNGGLVSEDSLVGIPTGIQWMTGPMFAMSGRKSSTQSLVSAGGRNFYITQNVVSNLTLPSMPQYLVARDAYNGLLLWTRPWTGPFVTGNGETNSRIVAVADRVYIVDEKGVSWMNAATGQTIQQISTPKLPQKMLYVDGILLLQDETGLTAYDVDSLKKRWTHAVEGASGVVADDGRVYFLIGDRAQGGQWEFEAVCVGLASGNEEWRQNTAEYASGRRQRINFVRDGYLALQSHGTLHLLSAKDGLHLWSRNTDSRPGKDYSDERFVGHFYRHGLVWMRGTKSETGNGSRSDSELLEKRVPDGQLLWLGLHPQTGRVEQELRTGGFWPETANPGKMGCQLLVASDAFLMIPRQSTFIDFQSGKKNTFKFIRGGCGLGSVPANGLLYTHPHACGCYSEVLRGFISMNSWAGSTVELDRADEPVRIEKGPAFGGTPIASTTSSIEEQDWPMYRHDGRRGAATTSRLPAELRPQWSTQIADDRTSRSGSEWALRVGNVVTSPVVAANKVFIAFPDAHRLVALDAETGEILWRYVACGRIDTPPTIHAGLCLFGAHDGWVYCLRADDGKLVWRYRVAPASRRIVAFGQVESVWPVAGTVLVQNGMAYVAAGRAPDADRGIHVFALHPQTGRVVWANTVSDEFYGLCDYLIGDGKHVYLSNWQFDAKTGDKQQTGKSAGHLRGGKVGLLEASWTKMDLALRKQIQDWTVGDAAGQLLAFSSGTTFGFRSDEESGELFATGTETWKLTVPRPSQVEAMILSPDVLFAAGPVNRSQRRIHGGVLWAFSPETGEKLGEVPLDAPPVYDGLAAGDGRLFVATEDGRLTCLAGQ